MSVKKLNTLELKLSRLEWKSVLEEGLDDEIKEIFLQRKRAVDLYIDGVKLNDINEITSISPPYILKLVKKCLAQDPITHEVFGYTGLIPYKRLKSYSRLVPSTGNSSGYSGALNKLFVDYPSLKIFLYNQLFSKNDTSLEKNITPTILHKKFLEECKKSGIEDYEYPFNTESKALKSF